MTDEKREQALRQLLLTAVAQVGVPVNECAQRDWVSPMLQFVPGLGPRKAHSVVKVRPHPQQPPIPAFASCTAHRKSAMLLGPPTVIAAQTAVPWEMPDVASLRASLGVAFLEHQLAPSHAMASECYRRPIHKQSLLVCSYSRASVHAHAALTVIPLDLQYMESLVHTFSCPVSDAFLHFGLNLCAIWGR